MVKMYLAENINASIIVEVKVKIIIMGIIILPIIKRILLKKSKIDQMNTRISKPARVYAIVGFI